MDSTTANAAEANGEAPNVTEKLSEPELERAIGILEAQCKAGTNGRLTKATILGNRYRRPKITPVNADAIPEVLKFFDRWHCWRYVWDKRANNGKGKWTKAPVNASTGKVDDQTEPKMWCGFERVMAALQSGCCDGISFALGEDDNGTHFAGIDVDDCRDPATGELSELARSIIDTMQTYWEVSPTGTGIKIFCFGTLPEGHATKNKEDTVESYTRLKSFTITGLRGDDALQRLEIRQEQLESVWQKYIGSEQKSRDHDVSNAARGHVADALAAMLQHKADPKENDSSKRLLTVCCRAVEFNLSDKAALETILEYAKQEPFAKNFTDDEIMDRIIQAEKREDVVRGSAVKKRAISYQIITSHELESNKYDTKFLIAGVMVQGQPMEIGGAMKSMKTSLMIDMAISLASGEPFLGKFKVKQQQRVLVMSGESGLATLQETSRRICKVKKVELGKLESLLWSQDLPKFANMDHIDAFDKLLDDNGIDSVYIDPVFLAMPSEDAGNLMAQGELLRSVSDVCQRRGTTLVLVHHTKRNTGHDPYEPLELQDLAWAGHAEFARQWVLVNRREKYKPGTGEHRLWLSFGGSAGHSSLWGLDACEGLIDDMGGRRWEMKIMDADEVRKEAKNRRSSDKQLDDQARLETDKLAIRNILAALPNQTGTKTDIDVAMGVGHTRVNQAFAALIRDEAIERTTITKGNNRQYDAFKLPKPE